MSNAQLIILLEKVLNKGYQLKNGEIAFHCPLCNHYKKKLQVNCETQKWHCWVCNTGGHNLFQLFKKIKVSREHFQELKELGYTTSYKEKNTENEITESVSLPKEFKSLIYNSKSMIYKHAIKYMKKRNILSSDIIKYNIGYCEYGQYANRIIIPSYNYEGRLNYFIARDIFPNSKMKYKNPTVSKDIIPFELFISWEHPIILCEGVFDAMAIKRNVIPLLGKFPSKTLVKKMISKKVKTVYIALDEDAKQDAIKLSKFLMDYGINTYLLKMSGKDPSELGFKEFWDIIKQSKQSKFSDIIKGRLHV